MPDPQILFWIAASVADIAVDNPNSIKTVLANRVSALFINGKPAVIYVIRKLRNPTSWLVLFVVVPFNKIPLFFK